MTIKRHIHHLILVSKHGHFGKAAEELKISQPALSSSILTLEKKLGVKLLDRKHGSIVATVFGELLITRGKELLIAEDELYREIDLLGNNQIGSFKVSFGGYPSVISGYKGIAQMLAKYPNIQICSHVKGWRDVVNSVMCREVDIGIAEISEIQDHEELDTELLGQHKGHFFCRSGHPLHTHKKKSMQQLFDYPWISTRLPSRLAKLIPKPNQVAGRIDPINGDFIPAIEIDVPIFLSELLINSDAIAPALISMVEDDFIAGKILPLLTNGFSMQTEYGFIYLKNRTLSPATLAFMQEIRGIESNYASKEHVNFSI